MAFDSLTFRGVLGHFPTGVTVLSAEVGGEVHGMTANAFMSVSLQPPLVLISVSREAHFHDRVAEAGRFAVSILGAGSAALSDHFAGRPGPEPAVVWRRHASGAPVLADALATLDCLVERAIDAGDHTLYLGRVVDMDAREGEPLVFFGGMYRTVG